MKIRFLDNNGISYSNWEEKKLKEIISVGKAGGTPVASNKNYYSGEEAIIPFLGISDMTEQGKYLTTTAKKITKNGLDSSSAWLVPAGYLVYAMYASVGKVGVTRKPMATSQAMFSMRFKDNVNLDYVYYYLDYFRDNGLNVLITTGTQGNINAETLKSLNIPLPSLPEQQKIAEFFSALDERIALTADKVKLLKEQKQGYLQKIFNRELVFADDNGNTYPEWEEKKLIEVASYNRKDRSFEDDFFYIDLESVSNGKVTMKEKISKEGAPSRAQRILQDQDVLFQNVRPYQNNHLLFKSSGWNSQVVASTGFTQLSAGENLVPEYLLQVFMTKSFGEKVAIRCTGTSYPAINSSELVDIQIPLPSLSEQEKIAEFFSALDEQIELTENNLTLLKEQKKGYLQGVFG